MEFNKNYDVTNLIKEMVNKNEISCYTLDSHEKVYIYEDVRDFGILRIQKDIGEDFQYKEGSYMVERNLFNKYEFIDFYNKKFDTNFECFGRKALEEAIDSLPILKVVKTIIIMDDNLALENEDYAVTHSLESAIEFALYNEDVLVL